MSELEEEGEFDGEEEGEEGEEGEGEEGEGEEEEIPPLFKPAVFDEPSISLDIILPKPPFFPLFNSRITWSYLTKKDIETTKKHKEILQKNSNKLESVVANLVAYQFYENLIKSTKLKKDVGFLRPNVVFQKLTLLKEIETKNEMFYFDDLIQWKDLASIGSGWKDLFLNKYDVFKKDDFSDYIILDAIAYGLKDGETYYVEYNDKWYKGGIDEPERVVTRGPKISKNEIAFVICNKLELKNDKIKIGDPVILPQSEEVIQKVFNHFHDISHSTKFFADPIKEFTKERLEEEIIEKPIKKVSDVDIAKILTLVDNKLGVMNTKTNYNMELNQKIVDKKIKDIIKKLNTKFLNIEKYFSENISKQFNDIFKQNEKRMKLLEVESKKGMKLLEVESKKGMKLLEFTSREINNKILLELETIKNFTKNFRRDIFDDVIENVNESVTNIMDNKTKDIELIINEEFAKERLIFKRNMIGIIETNIEGIERTLDNKLYVAVKKEIVPIEKNVFEKVLESINKNIDNIVKKRVERVERILIERLTKKLDEYTLLKQDQIQDACRIAQVQVKDETQLIVNNAINDYTKKFDKVFKEYQEKLEEKKT